MGDLDGPWKAALDVFFEPFMAVCFPRQHARIRWSAGVEMLEQELQQLAADSQAGRKSVDKLVLVTLNDGQQECILVHVEVQNRPQAEFAQRMFAYHYRLLDRTELPVASLAVLGDLSPGWRPDTFYRETLECQLTFRFPIVKLLDFSDTMLKESKNPFAALIYAHRGAMQTAGKHPDLRLDWKLEAFRLLLQQGHCVDDLEQLFRFLNWLLELPPLHAAQFRSSIEEMTMPNDVPFLTTWERAAMEEGREEGLAKGLERGVLIGRIRVLQEVLGDDISDHGALVEMSTIELQSHVARLQRRFKQ